jgi:hypothetical protein
MKQQRTLLGLALALLTQSALANLASAECYGDAAEAYGCGAPAPVSAKRSSRPASALESFGSSDEPVLPDLRYGTNGSDSDDVISPEERRQMMRSIVLGRGGNTASQAAHQQAVNSAARPLRRAQAMPARTR